MEKLMKDIAKIISEVKNIAIFGHTNPDGDCVGSLLGLKKILEKQGKEVDCFTPTLPSKIFSFFPETKKIRDTFDYGDYDILIFVDFSDYKRLENIYLKNPGYFHHHKIIVFDHHIGEKDQENRICIKDHSAMSNCEWIFENAKKVWNQYLDAEIATYFYMGLTTDSGNFSFDEDHERIFKNALDLVRLGADKKLIVSKFVRSKSLETIKFSELLISRLKKIGPILYSYYTKDDMEQYGVDQEQAGYGLTVIQNIKDAGMVITIRIQDNIIKGSIRTKPIIKNGKEEDIDALKIAKMFGGGGHKRAAGFSIIGSNIGFESQIKEIIGKIKKSL